MMKPVRRAAIDHAAHDQILQPQRREQIDRHQRVRVGPLPRRDVLHFHHAGAVDQAVDVADPIDQARQRIELCEVDDVARAAPELDGDALERRGIAIDQRELGIGPARSHRPCDRAADRSSRAGDRDACGRAYRHEGLDFAAAAVASSANHKTSVLLAPFRHIAGPMNTPGETSRISSWTWRM